MSRHTAPLSVQARQSYAAYTQKDRIHATLTTDKRFGDIGRLAARIENKYGLEKISDLKPGHISSVINDLKDEGKSSSTLTSYATAARLLATSVGKSNIVPRSNKEMGISRAGERYKPISQANQAHQIREKLAKRAFGSPWRMT